jgi:phosphoribosylaminoimidazolecarboxamide formyltransferase/IMP cyclohydrolase
MRALLSVFDKTGLVAFAEGLAGLGFELVASGGTALALGEAGLEPTEVQVVTGAPEMLDGRFKTLHPAIHAGILADRSRSAHLVELAQAGIVPIDLVVCNLYPFTSEPSIETIDIGGPTMIRAAAKNHNSVTVVVDPTDYGAVLDELRREGATTLATRRRLARRAFAHTASYDAAIVAAFDEGVLTGEVVQGLPETLHLSLEKVGSLRYGENPHQIGARYRALGGAGGFFDHTTQVAGRELSYLNLFDAEAAWRLAYELASLPGTSDAAVIVKHANPCGAAVTDAEDDLVGVHARALAGDPISAFGGIVALTGRIDLEVAEALVAGPLTDVLLAPSVSEDALQLLSTKRRNMRVLIAPPPEPERLSMRSIAGGLLVQEADRVTATRSQWRVVTKIAPEEEQWRDLELVWRVCAKTSSNAIVIAKHGQVLGVGAGQQNRRDSAAIATEKAAGRGVGGVAASDAFFPFRDGLEAVAAAGVSTVIEPGGSLRDDEVIAAADELKIALVLTGERHFRH